MEANKETYEEAKTEIIAFACEDIIQTSGDILTTPEDILPGGF